MWAFGGYLRFKPNLGMVVRACNPSTWGTKAGRWQIQSQPGLCNKTPSQKKKYNHPRRGFCSYLFCLKTALLSSNSQITRFTMESVQSLVFNMFTELCTDYHTQF
jgi:hypothetical protein